MSFEGADLRDADLQGATLEGAYLEDARLQGATYHLKTVWPAGFVPVAAGVVLSRGSA